MSSIISTGSGESDKTNDIIVNFIDDNIRSLLVTQQLFCFGGGIVLQSIVVVSAPAPVLALVNHEGKVGLADGVEVAARFLFVDNIAEDYVESHFELATQDAIVSMDDDAPLFHLVIGVAEGFDPILHVVDFGHSLFELVNKVLVEQVVCPHPLPQ